MRVPFLLTPRAPPSAVKRSTCLVCVPGSRGVHYTERAAEQGSHITSPDWCPLWISMTEQASPRRPGEGATTHWMTSRLAEVVH